MRKSPHGYDTRSWNPVTGCSKVSAGCKNCWAEEYSRRMGWPWEVTLHPERLDEPLRWRKPQVVATAYMGDLWHDDVPDEFIARVFAVMACARTHTFLLLTKRPARVATWAATASARDDIAQAILDLNLRSGAWAYDTRLPDHWPLPNVWLGVSVENQATADDRIPELLQTPAAHRWVSVEPLLEPIDLRHLDWTEDYLRKWAELRKDQPPDRAKAIDEIVAVIERDRQEAPAELDSLTGWRSDGEDVVAEVGDPHLDWVVVGGESGAGHRPCDPAWIARIVIECHAVQVPVWVKQDSHRYPGRQGRIPDALWGRKAVPWEPAP